jgi:Protein of unknown function (DUF2917)
MCDSSCKDAPDSTRVPGAFRLQNGRAISLYPKLPSLLRVMPESRSGLWATIALRKGAQQSSALSEDYFLQANQSLEVPAGAHLVIEPWRAGHSSACAASDAYFDWRVAAA